MSNRSPSRARCFRATCARRGKVKHECALCSFSLRACNFHRDVCFTALQQHVIAEHPAEYRAARDARPPARQATGHPAVSYGPEHVLDPGFRLATYEVGKKP